MIGIEIIVLTLAAVALYPPVMDMKNDWQKKHPRHGRSRNHSQTITTAEARWPFK